MNLLFKKFNSKSHYAYMFDDRIPGRFYDCLLTMMVLWKSLSKMNQFNYIHISIGIFLS